MRERERETSDQEPCFVAAVAASPSHTQSLQRESEREREAGMEAGDGMSVGNGMANFPLRQDTHAQTHQD